MALYYKLCSLPKVMPNLFTFSMDIHFSTPVGLLTNMVYMVYMVSFSGFVEKEAKMFLFRMRPLFYMMEEWSPSGSFRHH